jgi:protein-S-isoprenylcysteine O-methyltransferase Ste14
LEVVNRVWGLLWWEEKRYYRHVGDEEVWALMERKHSVLQKILQTMFVIMVPVGVATVWFGFLLLPIEWWLSWLICVVFLAVGTYIFALSRREFSRSGQKLVAEAHGTSKLITSGIYSLVRHPLTLASVLLELGIAFGFRSTVGLVIALASIILGYWFTLVEEKLLIQQFGDEYRRYRARVPMFVPKLRRRR